MHVKLDSSTCSLALLHNRLNNINLAFVDMDAAALSQLTALPRPQLQVLGLMGNRLTADAMASLISADIPNLNLVQNKLNTGAAGHLSKSIWRKLYIVYLQHNAFDDTRNGILCQRKLAKSERNKTVWQWS